MAYSNDVVAVIGREAVVLRVEKHVYKIQQPLHPAFNIRKQPQHEPTTIDCYEAAKKYGGVVIAEFRSRKPAPTVPAKLPPLNKFKY